MKVKDLIEKLSKYNQDLDVYALKEKEINHCENEVVGIMVEDTNCNCLYIVQRDD